MLEKFIFTEHYSSSVRKSDKSSGHARLHFSPKICCHVVRLRFLSLLFEFRFITLNIPIILPPTTITVHSESIYHFYYRDS
jgi:hypothetical protein